MLFWFAEAETVKHSISFPETAPTMKMPAETLSTGIFLRVSLYVREIPFPSVPNPHADNTRHTGI